MRKQKLLILSLTFTVIILFIAYYVFFMNNEVEEKNAKVKDLDVIFYKIDKIEELYSTGASAKIDKGKKRIFINAPNLMSKGAYVKIPITIKNVGKATAKLESIMEYGFNENGPISIIYEGIGVTDKALLPNEETEFYVIISWDKDMIETSASTNIEIRFNYIQSRR